MFLKKYLFIYLILSFLTLTKSQVKDSSNLIESEQNWFVSVNSGLHVSGIKDEDFVSSNYSPLFNITFGKWLLPHLALQIGYKGFYFNYIEDDIKHNYHYLYGEAVLNLNNIVLPERVNKSWSLLIHAGAGYFYNHLYDKSQICANIGIQNSYRLSYKFQVNLDITSVIGWRIYQRDEDILPGITLGITYLFASN